jgi:hypothetical protein
VSGLSRNLAQLSWRAQSVLALHRLALFRAGMLLVIIGAAGGLARLSWLVRH